MHEPKGPVGRIPSQVGCPAGGSIPRGHAEGIPSQPGGPAGGIPSQPRGPKEEIPYTWHDSKRQWQHREEVVYWKTKY